MSLLLTLRNSLPAGLARESWVTDNQARADRIARYRRYVAGDFDANMTREMREMLRLRQGAEFGANYCDTVVQTMADRLRVTAIHAAGGESPAATAWAAALLDWNRFDSLQMDVHEAAIRDGDTYVMVSYDNTGEMPLLTHELAYDGTEGLLVVHDPADSAEIACALKVWRVTRARFADTLRVNLYYPDRIERYTLPAGGGHSQPTPYDADGLPPVLAWRLPDGTPVGVPVVQFSNRKRGDTGYGQSEIANALPLQDALNRTLHSMVMAAELSAFQVRYAVGVRPPAAIVPGMILSVHAGVDDAGQPKAPTEGQLKWFDAIRFGAFEQGEIEPFIAQARFIIEQMRTTTRTPNPEAVGAAASGESRKQAEVGLLGKCERFQVKAGDAWETVLWLAERVARAYGAGGRSQPPGAPDAWGRRWECRWKPAALRDEAALIDTVLKLRDYLTREQVLRVAAGALGTELI